MYLTLVEVSEDKYIKHSVNMMENIHPHRKQLFSLRSSKPCDTGLSKIKCKLVCKQESYVASFNITLYDFNLKILIASKRIT